MDPLEQHLKRIQDKLQKLLKQYATLEKENIGLKKDLDDLTQNSTQDKQSIDQLKQTVEVLKISSGNWNDRDKKEFEKRVNHYIKEIDRCITLLKE